MTNWLVTGGAGFIGQHLAGSILSRDPSARVVSIDLVAPEEIQWRIDLQQYRADGRLQVLHGDVRDYQALQEIAGHPGVIVNLAAVHREPGHRPDEYFATNVQGAENVNRFAVACGCREIIFTSSISVYGRHDRSVDEESPVQPRTPYGQSKYEAEQIHVQWAKETNSRLCIIRPGVVFGPGEEGNVSRLMREMLSRQRAIRLRPDRRKAGIYIEELIEAIHWLRVQELKDDDYQLVNGVSKDVLSFNAFGQVLGELQGFHSKPLEIPIGLIKAASVVINPLAGLIASTSRFHPERLAKLCRANDVRATSLNTMGYPFAWPLPRALADWLERGI